MGQSINLVPREVKTEQVKVKVVKASTVVTILLLLVIGGISGYFQYENLQLKANIDNNEKEITKLRKDIEDMSDIEIVARNLDKKFLAISEILGNRPSYSLLMEETKRRVPETIVINEFLINKDNSLSLDGSGQTYLSISEFYGNLGSPQGDFDQALAKLFNDITLNSVNFESRDNSAKYSITTKFDRDLLKK